MCLFWLWKYLVSDVVYVVFCICNSGDMLVGVVMMIECVSLFLLRICLMNFFILWLCLLIRLIMIIFVFV